MIEQTNEWYCRNRKGTVAKIPNGTKTIRVGGKPVVIPTNKTGCDFIGHLKDGQSPSIANLLKIKLHFHFMLEINQC